MRDDSLPDRYPTATSRWVRIVAILAFMTTNELTAPTITTAQIRALRTEALEAGDSLQVDLCDVALSGQDSDGTGTTLGTPCTAADALEACADVINAARAQETK